MPFFDDSGVDTSERRGPLWGAFATLRDQVERLVALNVAWSAQLLPALVALGFPELPLWLRAALLLYSLTALAPATGLLYALALRAARGEHLGLDLARQTLAEIALPSLRTLAPLFGTLGALAAAALALGQAGGALVALDVLARLLLLLLLFCSAYWGPLVADQPQLGVVAVARRAAGLAWRYPGRTLLACGAVLLALLLAAISVGGLFLIAPALAALLQAHMYEEVLQLSRPAQPASATRAS